MKITLLKDLLQSMRAADNEFKKLSAAEKTKLEDAWDIEHAYYSSALEGSKLDRKDVEDLAQSQSAT